MRRVYSGGITPVTIFGDNDNSIGVSGYPMNVYIGAVLSSSNDVSAPAANTAATITYAAIAGYQHVISGLSWSYYGGIPTGGQVTITDGVVTIFQVDIAEEGPGFFVFPRPKSGANNSNLVITLTAGGTGITGKLNVINHWLEDV